MGSLLLPRLQVTWAQGFFSEQELYWLTAGVMAAAAVLFLAWTIRHPGRRRRYAAVTVYTSVVISVTYAGMATGVLRYETLDGTTWVPVTRFVGYAFGISVILWTTGVVGGLSRKVRVGLLVAFAMIAGGTLGSWFLPSPTSTVASVSSLLSLPLVAYLFLGPGARAAADVSDDRRLLYGKLANVAMLAWLGYLVVGITSRQNLALLDGFAGVFIGVYLDVILHVGFGVLLLRSGVVLDQLVDGDDAGDGGDGAGETTSGSATATAD